MLELHIRAMEAVFERVFTFVFNKECTKVQMKPGSTPSLASVIENLSKTVNEVVPNQTFANALIKALPKLTDLADAKQSGSIKQPYED